MKGKIRCNVKGAHWFDEVFVKKVKDADIMIEMNGTYLDDNNIFVRSIGRKVKFCPLTGRLAQKTEDEVKESDEMREDKVTMEELRKIADTCLGMLKSEADFTYNHPELGYKFPILYWTVWEDQMK